MSSITPRAAFAALAALGLATLGFALFSQFVGHYEPCELCLLQRWPWDIAIAIGLIGFLRPWPPLLTLAGLALLVGAGIAAYHVGVEQHWWPGPEACTTGLSHPQTIEELRAQMESAPHCDVVAWTLFGLSMATYNFIVSLIGGIAAIAAALRLMKVRHAR